MGRIYRESTEYLKTRQERLQRHRTRRKNKARATYYVDEAKDSDKAPTSEQKLLLGQSKHIKSDLSRQVKIKISRTFCIIKNPVHTIRLLKRINKLFFRNKNLNIYIDISECEELGIGATALLDLIIVRGVEYLNKNGFKCKMAGNQPINDSANRLFMYSGLLKHIGIVKNDNANLIRLDPFRTINHTNDEVLRIVDYYNKCLNKSSLQLSDKGKIYIPQLVNEIVDNAIIHKGDKGSFYVAGHYDDNDKIGKLTIINYGNTIYETLNGPITSEDIREALNNQENYHKSLFNIDFDKEVSWTVFGLQYGISSRKSEKEKDRGRGTFKFIEAFMQLGSKEEKKPQMAIYSGNTHILFDGTYYLKKTKNKNREVIAFNKNNDLKQKPDKNYVKRLVEKFPGVIISIELFVDQDYLQRFKEKEQ